MSIPRGANNIRLETSWRSRVGGGPAPILPKWIMFSFKIICIPMRRLLHHVSLTAKLKYAFFYY